MGPCRVSIDLEHTRFRSFFLDGYTDTIFGLVPFFFSTAHDGFRVLLLLNGTIITMYLLVDIDDRVL